MLFKVLLLVVLISSVNLTDINYYEVLGVNKQASSHEIRQAYKKLAVKLHPDKNPDAKEQEKFLQLTEAYDTLKDPDKRHKYDSYPSYTHRYDTHSQAEYNNLYYNGLYSNDLFVDTLSPNTFDNYLSEGFHFINFYSPFCPPCQALVDTWKSLAEKYQGIIKFGAVNCKHYNSFCYNSMRISSYPTLLFYTDGERGEHTRYGGRRELADLDEFAMAALRDALPVDTAPAMRADAHAQRPLLYVRADAFPADAITRIAHHLRGSATVVAAEEETLRAALAAGGGGAAGAAAVLQAGGARRVLRARGERDLLRAALPLLPGAAAARLDPARLQAIRDALRGGRAEPWVLRFTFGDAVSEADATLSRKLMARFPRFDFGEVDCREWAALCATLHVAEEEGEGARWAVLKAGGAYQRMAAGAGGGGVERFVREAVRAPRLHTLSVSELRGILDADDGDVWVAAEVPRGARWERLAGALAEAAARLARDRVQFGVAQCTARDAAACGGAGGAGGAAVAVRAGRRRRAYGGLADAQHLIDFVRTVADTAVVELAEAEAVATLAAEARGGRVWLAAFLPAGCGSACERLEYEWTLVADKLSVLEEVRVAALRCGSGAGGAGAARFCDNVRAATVKLYLPHSAEPHVASMAQLPHAPYLLEWALSRLPAAPRALSAADFEREVRGAAPSSRSRPWLVYFHSPRCYRCYEMFADFVLAAVRLGPEVHAGRVDCTSERRLCQEERVTRYPALRLYASHARAPPRAVPLSDHRAVLAELRPLVARLRPAHDEL